MAAPLARVLLISCATQAASFGAWMTGRPAPVPCTRALRTGVSGARLCAAADADSAKPLQDYVEELRRGKAALRRGLLAERGALSEDGLAVALGLAKLNPTAPDPAADSDLWEGCEFTLLSSALPLLGAPPPLWQGETKLRVETGAATLNVQVLEGAVGAAALLGDGGQSDADFAAARAQLLLRLAFNRSGDATLDLTVNQAELTVNGRPGSGAMAAVAMASMAAGASWQLAAGADPTSPDAARVLQARELPLAAARLSLMYLDQDLAVVGWAGMASDPAQQEEAQQYVLVFGR